MGYMDPSSGPISTELFELYIIINVKQSLHMSDSGQEDPVPHTGLEMVVKPERPAAHLLNLDLFVQ